MQTPSAFAIDIPAQGAWSWTVRGMAAASVAVVLAWCLLPEQALDQPTRLGLAVAASLAAAWAWLGSNTAACRLRWDGSAWWVGAAACGHEHMFCGNLRVMIGLPSFLLLRFDATTSHPQQVRWIPVLRSSVKAQWHVLCCAVYSARPAEGAFSTGDLPRTAPTRPEPHE